MRPMTKKYLWTNPSVLRFADGQDPVQRIERAARELALNAMDGGWSGPPFDPLALAEWRGLQLEARGDIPDARLMPTAKGDSVLQYNPMRPRGRLRFSIAHEIAHTLFPDHAEQVRNRAVNTFSGRPDNWQLEVLCNIGAAELLMPLGSFSELAGEKVTIQKVMDIRKHFDVSTEACIIRLIKLATTRIAAFCASVHEGGQHRVDYVISAAGWECPIKIGQLIPVDSVVKEATSINFTAAREEAWVEGATLRVECVALAPYPGAADPRVVGLLIDPEGGDLNTPNVHEVDGDALQPRGKGKKLLVHVVPNTTAAWGGRGFASALRRKFPQTWEAFRSETVDARRSPALGQVYMAPASDDITVAHMVAQQGFGASNGQRLRYAALSQCLQAVRQQAKSLNATVHMPRIGTGHGGADWQVVRELIAEELVDKGIQTTVYRLPANAGV
jgi:O-acetyl-ADP-ribose deacetylase (regulator of RNase III)